MNYKQMLDALELLKKQVKLLEENQTLLEKRISLLESEQVVQPSHPYFVPQPRPLPMWQVTCNPQDAF